MHWGMRQQRWTCCIRPTPLQALVARVDPAGGGILAGYGTVDDPERQRVQPRIAASRLTRAWSPSVAAGYDDGRSIGSSEFRVTREWAWISSRLLA